MGFRKINFNIKKRLQRLSAPRRKGKLNQDSPFFPKKLNFFPDIFRKCLFVRVTTVDSSVASKVFVNGLTLFSFSFSVTFHLSVLFSVLFYISTASHPIPSHLYWQHTVTTVLDPSQIFYNSEVDAVSLHILSFPLAIKWKTCDNGALVRPI